MGNDPNRELDVLRVRAEDAVRQSREASELSPLLERMVELAAPGTDDALFARRHLAELLVESHPWGAALHLREVAKYVADDDVVYALMGLCQALLGNFRSAATSYKRATRLAPRNPWYHHNLGHLLDVALGQPEGAVNHLRLAHQLEPEEHEITASLAHCLARCDADSEEPLTSHPGEKRVLSATLREALELAEEASRMAPESADHKALVQWIQDGATTSSKGPRFHSADPSSRDLPDGDGAPPPTSAPGSRSLGDVEKTLERGMREAGFSPKQLDQARALWADFQTGRRLKVMKPESYAAAVEYAIACVQRMDGVTQTSIAKRYGIARRTLAHRYLQIRDALELEPGDPRYLAH